MSSSGRIKTGRFIRMDFSKWSNPDICSPFNNTKELKDGKIYEIYTFEDCGDLYFEDFGGDD